MNPSGPRNYEEWLGLSEEEQQDVLFRAWDPYQRKGVLFPYIAATRLAIESEFEVLDINVGTYHGGEYVLHMMVSKSDFSKCPAMLEQQFEGFRVVWLPAQEFSPGLSIDASLGGKWVPEDERNDYEFDFVFSASGVVVNGFCRATQQQLVVQHSSINNDHVVFSAYHPTKKQHTQHAFSLVSADRCEDRATLPMYYLRSES